MRLRLEQLPSHLQNDLQRIYLVSGEEPFQLQQASQAIREKAQQSGFNDREILQVDRSFDWQQLLESANTLSLFSQQRLLELRLPSAKPGDAGSKALTAYCTNPPEDTVLLIVAGKLEKAQQNSKWFKAIEQAGTVIQIWPVESAAMPGWIENRMRSRNMQPTPDALMMLADRFEGNLLAADQELEKLRLSNGEGEVNADQVASAVSDSSRYDVFSLVDSCLLSEQKRAIRILFGLRNEGVEPILVLWALTRELRALSAMSQALSMGQSMGQVFSQYRVWEKRKKPVQNALTNHNLRRLHGLIWQSGEIDKVIKGQATGNAWDELLQLVLKLCGTPLFAAVRSG